MPAAIFIDESFNQYYPSKYEICAYPPLPDRLEWAKTLARQNRHTIEWYGTLPGPSFLHDPQRKISFSHRLITTPESIWDGFDYWITFIPPYFHWGRVDWMLLRSTWGAQYWPDHCGAWTCRAGRPRPLWFSTACRWRSCECPWQAPVCLAKDLLAFNWTRAYCWSWTRPQHAPRPLRSWKNSPGKESDCWTSVQKLVQKNPNT